jgi:serine protease Do
LRKPGVDRNINLPMNPTAALAATCLVAFAAPAPARPFINDKMAPEDRRDLLAIQSALHRSLPAARAATVAIELDGGSGSGVIVSVDGLVLTAAHVSTGVDKELKVVMEDGTRHDAVSLGLVASSDAAMVRILGDGPFPFVDFDRKDETRLGDWVFSLGHSGGYDENRGSVLRLGRVVRIANATFQSDCMLIGGDSGGPLFDLDGRLVAIHSRVGQRLPENMHVPMREFLRHWEAMEKGEFVGEGPFAQKKEKGTGFLGLVGEAVDDGLKVTRVAEESPAAEAGIEVDDVILTINEKPVSDRDTLREILAGMAAGDRLTMEIRRTSGEKETLNFRLGER